jgi:hypothetical protein
MCKLSPSGTVLAICALGLCSACEFTSQEGGPTRRVRICKSCRSRPHGRTARLEDATLTRMPQRPEGPITTRAVVPAGQPSPEWMQDNQLWKDYP